VKRQVGSSFQRMSGQKGRREDLKWRGVLVLWFWESKIQDPGWMAAAFLKNSEVGVAAPLV